MSLREDFNSAAVRWLQKHVAKNITVTEYVEFDEYVDTCCGGNYGAETTIYFKNKNGKTMTYTYYSRADSWLDEVLDS